MRIQLFNLETMSGVFPGVRTQVFQRLFLQPLFDEPTVAHGTGAMGVWAQLFWYDEPRSCVLYMLGADTMPTADAGAPPDDTRTDAGTPAEMTVALRLEDPQMARLVPTLQATLATNGWQVVTCGSCGHWQASAAGEDAVPDNAVPLGRCGWQGDDVNGSGSALRDQSALALGCPHWRNKQAAVQASPVGALDFQDTEPQGVEPHDAESQGVESQDSDAQSHGAATEATSSPNRPSLWARVASFFTQQIAGSAASPDPPLSLSQRIVERSGVGAGTQPCFACQGRIANLGALVVETVEGDRQTLSVWRCRLCYTFYLNNWIDRWERLDSLETQESFYRLAPSEALHLLQRMESVVGGEHPAQRTERAEQRSWFEAFMAQREPLSHQVKLGR